MTTLENSIYRARTINDTLPPTDQRILEIERELERSGRTLDDTLTLEQARRLRETLKK